MPTEGSIILHVSNNTFKCFAYAKFNYKVNKIDFIEVDIVGNSES